MPVKSNKQIFLFVVNIYYTAIRSTIRYLADVVFHHSPGKAVCILHLGEAIEIFLMPYHATVEEVLHFLQGFIPHCLISGTLGVYREQHCKVVQERHLHHAGYGSPAYSHVSAKEFQCGLVVAHKA